MTPADCRAAVEAGIKSGLVKLPEPQPPLPSVIVKEPHRKFPIMETPLSEIQPTTGKKKLNRSDVLEMIVGELRRRREKLRDTDVGAYYAFSDAIKVVKAHDVVFRRSED